MKTQINLKVDDGELGKWKGKAESEDKSLSEWIRKKCNAEEGANTGMRAAEDASVLGRSTLSGGGAAESPKPRARKSEFAESIAGRTGHEIGCGCFDCVQVERFFRAMRKEA